MRPKGRGQSTKVANDQSRIVPIMEMISGSCPKFGGTMMHTVTSAMEGTHRAG